jgi:hypothetical protein
VGLVRIGPIVLDLEDIRAIVDKGDPKQGEGSVEVTFRDGSRMEFDGAQAEALRRFVLNLPDGIPVIGANDAVMGVVGRRADVPPVKRQEG